MDIRKVRLGKVEKHCVNDPTAIKKYNDKSKLNETIFFNTKHQAIDNREKIRINSLKKMKPFADFDGDGIPNAVDRRPKKKDKTFWNMLK